MATSADSLPFDGTEWKREISVLFNGIEIPIEIEPENYETDGEAALMSPVQIEALRIVLSLPRDVLETSAPAVVQNYEVYREMLSDEELPPLAKPVEVWEKVAPSRLSIPPHGDLTIPTFLLLAECDWDPEHGLAVRFRNGVADASNQQGEISVDD